MRNMIKTTGRKKTKKTAVPKISKAPRTRARPGNSSATANLTEAVYETAKDLFALGAIDQATMREFDILCVPKVPRYTARQIKNIRTRCKCSQPVFAAYLNVTPSSLKQWESGAKRPAGAARKLFHVWER